jgi:hypothetical protein
VPTRSAADRRLIITLTPAVLDRLRSRGAQSDRHHGPYNYTRQLTRTLELYGAALVRSDPRETRGLPAAHYDLVLDLLEEPERLETFHIHRLGDYLLDLPGFAARAHGAGAAAGDLAAALNAMTFAEKLHLVDAAQIHNATPARTPAARPAGATRPTGARVSAARAAAAKPLGAKPAAIAAVRAFPAKSAAVKASGAKTGGSKAAGAKPAGTKPPAAKPAGTEVFPAKAAPAKAPPSKASPAKAPPAKAAPAKAPAAKPPGARTAAAQLGAAKAPAAKTSPARLRSNPSISTLPTKRPRRT